MLPPWGCRCPNRLHSSFEAFAWPATHLAVLSLMIHGTKCSCFSSLRAAAHWSARPGLTLYTAAACYLWSFCYANLRPIGLDVHDWAVVSKGFFQHLVQHAITGWWL
eukprot:1156319-Amphidinium_carterae.1